MYRQECKTKLLALPKFQIVFDKQHMGHMAVLFADMWVNIIANGCSYFLLTRIGHVQVNIDRRDPFACAAGKHFNLIAKKYGAPIIVLNLVKRKEKRPRESILADELSRWVRRY